MKRIAVIGTVVALMVIMLTAGIAGAQGFPGQDQYETPPTDPGEIAAFVAALIATILEFISNLLAGIFGRFFG